MKTTKSVIQYPTIKYVNDKYKQAYTYLISATNIRNGRYPSQNFIILPHRCTDSNRVYFPKPNEKVSKYLWEYVDLYKESLKLKNLIKNVGDDMEFEIPEYRNEVEILNRTFKDFWKELHNYFDAKYLQVSEIHISKSYIGSIGSNHSYWKKDSSIIEIHKREDADITYYFQLILLERLNRYQKELKLIQWRDRIAVLDYLSNCTRLAKYITKPISLLGDLNKKESNDIKLESSKYLLELGFGNTADINIYNNYITINKDIINVTKNEYCVIKSLYENKSHTVDYDTLAQAIWHNDYIDKFSYQAINKIVERVRKKIERVGYNKNMIKTVRNVGYALS